MSVALPSERHAWWCPDAPCLYCGADVPLDEPAVIWAAHDTLMLHRDCARKLGVHLISDAREADMCQGTSPWGRRAVRAARGSLVMQEWRG